MMTAQTETVTVAKKSTSSTTPKKAVKTPTNKPLSNSTHSEKQPVRTSSSSVAGTAAISTKPAEKKLSDNLMSTPVKSTEAVSAKPPPVTFGKIPKLNPANKQKPSEKPAPSASLTDFKLDLLASDSSLPGSASKEMSLSEKAPPHRQLLPLKPRPLSPMDLDDNADSILGKPPFLTSNQRAPTKFSRANSIGPDNTQSQSPLSPVRPVSMSHLFVPIEFQGPLSTLYPPPSPPLPPRPAPASTTAFIDARSKSSHSPFESHASTLLVPQHRFLQTTRGVSVSSAFVVEFFPSSGSHVTRAARQISNSVGFCVVGRGNARRHQHSPILSSEYAGRR